MADHLLMLREELTLGAYRPGPYRHFVVHDEKRRLISAAPFRDRVVHHALCQVIEPLFERRFIGDSYANRRGKGTLRAVQRFAQFSRRYRYVLRLDVVQHFASIDHEMLTGILRGVIQDSPIMSVIGHILQGGANIPHEQTAGHLFPGDDLLHLCRPRGLPVGNLTSQFWSNCYLHPFDQFVRRELRCRAYLRYVDDFALFSDDKQQLWAWKQAIIERLERFRLRIHTHSAQVCPTRAGSPWLGWVVYPYQVRLKGRKVRHARRRLYRSYARVLAGELPFATFDAQVRGWLAHAAQGDTWRLREALLEPLVWVFDR